MATVQGDTADEIASASWRSTKLQPEPADGVDWRAACGCKPHAPTARQQLIRGRYVAEMGVPMARIADPQPAGPTNAKQIAAFEKHIGHQLPTAYREFLLQHNGGHPVPDAFILRLDRGEEEDIVMCFFPLRELKVGQVEVEDLEELRTWPLHCAWDDLQSDLQNLYEKELDPPLLPIGTDGSSNYISLILTGDKTGAVVFLDNETAEPWPLAPSFPAFLESLRPRQRTDYHPALGPGS